MKPDNKIGLFIANKFCHPWATYVKIYWDKSKIGFCKECHKLKIIGREDKICSGCESQAWWVAEATAGEE